MLIEGLLRPRRPKKNLLREKPKVDFSSKINYVLLDWPIAQMTKPSIKEVAKDTLAKITTMAKSNMSNL